MKKPPFTLLNTFKLFLFITTIFIISCVNQEEKENDTYVEASKSNIETVAIDFNLIDSLNQSNQKVIDLTTLAFNQNHSSKKLLLLLKIKRDHQKINSELKSLTEKNLIIIPKPIYDLHIDCNELDPKNPNVFLLKALENQIKNEISVLNKIEKNAKNLDYKIFIIKSKKIAQRNYDVLLSY